MILGYCIGNYIYNIYNYILYNYYNIHVLSLGGWVKAWVKIRNGNMFHQQLRFIERLFHPKL